MNQKKQPDLCERLHQDGGCDRRTFERPDCEYQKPEDYIERTVTKEISSVGWGNSGTWKQKEKERYYRCTRPKT